MAVSIRHFVLLLLIGSATAAAWSFPTMFGDTGLVLSPTADTLQNMHIDAMINVTRLATSSGKDTLAVPMRICYGATDSLEFSGVFSESHGPADISQAVSITGLGAKFALSKELLGRGTPGVALGGRFYRITSDASTDNLEGYCVVSKVLYGKGDMVTEGFVVRGHGGLLYRDVLQDNSSMHSLSPFLGLSYKNVNGTSIVGEYLPSASDMSSSTKLRPSSFSVSFRQPISGNFTAEMGITRAFGLANTTSYNVGLLYHFGEEYSVGEKKYPVLF